MVELLAEFVVQCLSKDFSNIQAYNNFEDLGAIGENLGPAPRAQQLSSGLQSASKNDVDPPVKFTDEGTQEFENEGGELDQLEEEKLVDATFAQE